MYTESVATCVCFQPSITKDFGVACLKKRNVGRNYFRVWHSIAKTWLHKVLISLGNMKSLFNACVNCIMLYLTGKKKEDFTLSEKTLQLTI